MKKLTVLSLATISLLAINTSYANSKKLVNPASGHSYQRFDKAKTWSNAKTSCEKIGAHLATINSQIENDWLMKKGIINTSSWLGGSDAQNEGTWLWVTDETWNYSNWSGGEPNNQGDENSLETYSDGTWNDLNDAGNAMSYICEWEGVPPKTYSQLISLPSIINTFALLGEQGDNYVLFIYDNSTQNLVNQAIITPKIGYEVKSITVTEDSNSNGVSELAILVNKTANNTSAILRYDADTANLVSTVNLPKN